MNLSLTTGCRANSNSHLAPSFGFGLVLLLALISVYRGLALSAADLQLYFDEAYYWTWSTQPAFGYYSKPPMIAWWMYLASGLCGESEICLRSGSLLLYPMAATFIYLAGRRLFDSRTGFYAAVAYASLPVVAFYSWLMTTDALLSFFCSMALFGLVEALTFDRWRDWLLTGAAIGGGLLSKYTMVFFPLSVLLYAALDPTRRARFWSRKVLAGALLCLCLFLPNLLWNASFGFPSFRHTAETAHWGREWFHPDRCLIFLGGQILLFGPALALAPLLIRWRTGRAWVGDSRYRLLLCLSLPLVGIYAIQALIARANLNWALASFVPASLLVAAYLLRAEKSRMLIAALVINFILGAAVYHYWGLAERLGFSLGQQADPYASMKGWRELGIKVQQALTQYPEAGLASDNRRVLSELMYYIEPHPLDGVIWNPSGAVSDQFRLTADLSLSKRKSFLFVSAGNPAQGLKPYFDELVDLGPVEIQTHADHTLRYQLFLARHFRGYKP